MWKAVGSVRSGDDKSVRSNKSRQQIKFEHFETKSIDRSRQSSNIDRSFCHDYFQKKRQNRRNNTFDQRTKSQKSIRLDQSKHEDMFSNMRNKKLSKLSHKDSQVNNNGIKQSVINNQKSNGKLNPNNAASIQNAQIKIRTLKKDQKKLKRALQQQMTDFKNIILRLQDTIVHGELIPNGNNQKKQTKNQNQNEGDLDILKQIIAQANGLNSFFNDLDVKKSAILANLGNNDK